MINIEVICENPQVLVTRFTANGSPVEVLEKLATEYVKSLYIDLPARVPRPAFTRYVSSDNPSVQIVVVHR